MSWLEAVETPCLVVDMDIARRNAREMQAVADACGCRLRPHIKTHKMPSFAKLQLEAGACGITCAKVSEAEVMADGGADDIFIAYPMVGAFRVRRAIALSRRVRRLILAVDSLPCARALDEAARASGTVLEVRLEIDTGAGRTGAARDGAVRLAKEIVETMPGLRLTGLYTFKGLTLEGQPTRDAEAAAREECALMRSLREAAEAAGLPRLELSGGSTPTGRQIARCGGMDEIRPGTYLFNDLLLVAEGAAAEADIAARYVVTVVAVTETYAVIDGGSKAFSADIPLHAPPYHFAGYARGAERPELVLTRMNEEHGILTCERGPLNLSVGERVTLFPLHVCTAVNLQNSVYLLEGDTLTKVPVAARGMTV